MSVSSLFRLPANPTDGSVVYAPLRGDGYNAPNGMYSVLSQVTCDASGGSATVTIEMDDRYQSIVYMAQLFRTGDTASQDCKFELVSEHPIGARHRYRALGGDLFNTVLLDEGLFAWQPPLQLDTFSLIAMTENIDTVVVNAQAWIWLFERDVFQARTLAEVLRGLPWPQWTNSIKVTT